MLKKLSKLKPSAFGSKKHEECDQDDSTIEGTSKLLISTFLDHISLSKSDELIYLVKEKRIELRLECLTSDFDFLIFSYSHLASLISEGTAADGNDNIFIMELIPLLEGKFKLDILMPPDKPALLGFADKYPDLLRFLLKYYDVFFLNVTPCIELDSLSVLNQDFGSWYKFSLIYS